MTGIEIFLIVAGIVCICASFFSSRKQKPEEDVISSPASVSAEIWTEKDEEMVRERIHEMLSGEQDETVAAVKEQLERMCNEKIMAVDEFSGQILEKIKSNHQEVVFMYNMLNDKQGELKTVMEDARVQEEALREAGRRQEMMPQTATARSAAPVTQADSLRGKKVVRQTQTAVPVSQTAVPALSAPQTAAGMQTAISRMEAAKAAKRAGQKQPAVQQSAQQLTQPAKTVSQAGQATVRRPAVQPDHTVPESTQEPVASSGAEDVNQRIRKMYKEGKNVLEISQALNIGQGEVKLVIALYGGKKR